MEIAGVRSLELRGSRVWLGDFGGYGGGGFGFGFGFGRRIYLLLDVGMAHDTSS